MASYPRYPTYVVVDTLNGYVISTDDQGFLLNAEEASSLAWSANYDRRPGYKTYLVFKLVPEQTNTYDGPPVRITDE